MDLVLRIMYMRKDKFPQDGKDSLATRARICLGLLWVRKTYQTSDFGQCFVPFGA